MSSEVKEATQAMDIARKAADKAGLVFHQVLSAKRRDGFWLVQLRSLTDRFIVKINALTGEVVEFSPVE